MSATFSIIVNAVRTTTVGELTNVVRQVDWTMRGTEQGQTFDLPQSTMLPGPDAQSFIDFEDLTEAEVVGWIETYVPDLQPIRDHIQFVLDREVAKAALDSAVLPWAPPPPPEPPAP